VRRKLSAKSVASALVISVFLTAATGATQEHWSVAFPGWGKPAVSEDSAYFLTRNHEVVAVDTTTRRARWHRRVFTNSPSATFPFGSTVVATRTAIIAGDYDLIALDPANGVLRWRFSPAEGHGPGMYLGDASEDVVYAGSAGGYLHAVDISTGRIHWSVRPPDSDMRTTVYQPGIYGRLVVYGFTKFGTPNTGGLLALDRDTGKVEWCAYFPRDPERTTTNSAWAGGPAFWDEIVIAASSDGSLHGFDATNGRPLLKIPAVRRSTWHAQEDFRPVVVVDDVLIAGSLAGRVSAYSLPSTIQSWDYIDRELGGVAYGMTSDSRFVYVPFTGGRIVAMDPSTGRVRWQSSQDAGSLTWPPAVTADWVYAASSSALVALRH